VLAEEEEEEEEEVPQINIVRLLDMGTRGTSSLLIKQQRLK
jgi:hypothetical protein